MILLCTEITMHALKIATTSTKSSAMLTVQVWDDTRAPEDLTRIWKPEAPLVVFEGGAALLAVLCGQFESFKKVLQKIEQELGNWT